jgi:2-hydroxy-3-keto-5-methylthiopentenyl-1-phosphate phosphatase
VEDARFIHENCRGLNINIVDGYINEEINSIKTKMLSEKLSYEDYVKGLRSVPAS